MKSSIISKLNRSRGCLVGGAAGDALGYAVEFNSRQQILERYGAPGITEYSLDAEGVALISDDTQMTLFTAEGLLRAAATGNDYLKEIERSYLVWLATQTEFQLPIAGSELSNVRPLWARRAPGNTCLSALSELKNGLPVSNSSKGCGGVMRVAPIGLYFAARPHSNYDRQTVASLAAAAAHLTHHHPLSDFASALCALIIYDCIRANEQVNAPALRAIVEQNLPLALAGNNNHAAQTFTQLITLAMDLAASAIADTDAISRLGLGWVAEEALSIALFSAMRHIADFEKCIVCAVNHSGDSDSTGAIAGNIIGAIVGYSNISPKFIERLEMKQLILSVADTLSGRSEAINISSSETFLNTMKYTPDNITALAPDEVFVFGSNLAGQHAGGAARAAWQKFGAIWGQGVGLQGQSYAIPTMQGGVETIRPYVDQFLDYAEQCDQTTFLVTRIGCGIAGFTDAEIAPLFRRALSLYNVRLPKSFVDILLR